MAVGDPDCPLVTVQDRGDLRIAQALLLLEVFADGLQSRELCVIKNRERQAELLFGIGGVEERDNLSLREKVLVFQQGDKLLQKEPLVNRGE